MSNAFYHRLVIILTFIGFSAFSITAWAEDQGQASQELNSTVSEMPDPSSEKVFQALMNSISQKDYQRFVSYGSKGFKNRISDIMFQGLAGEIGERMAQGYQAQYLTVLTQGRYKTYLWKLTFSDNGVEFLAKMTLDLGAVVGFIIN